MKRFCLAVFVLVSFSFGVLETTFAGIVGYWRFEDTPGFLSDSSPNNQDLQSVNGAGPISSPFENPVPQTVAPNAQAANLDKSGGSFGQYLYRSVAPGDSLYGLDRFTIEAYVNLKSSDSGYIPRSIASQFDHYTGNANQLQWNFVVTGEGSGFGARNLLMILSGDGKPANVKYLDSDLQLTLGTSYYAAATVDVDSANGAMVDFYLKELDVAGSTLQHSTAHLPSLTSLHDASGLLRLGAEWSTTTSPHVWDGLLDEVRFSDSVLDEAQLLVTASAVPEPSSLVLWVSVAVCAVAWRGRRKRR